MNDGFDDEHDSSHGLSEITNLSLEINAQQSDIRQNLAAIGPEIAAYYSDGIQILQHEGLITTASLLAHVAREIDGGLRDILSSGEAKKHIKKQLTKEILEKLGNYDKLKDRKGHIASILAALGIDDVRVSLSTDETHINFAIRWINVATQFHRFVHRHGAWRVPRAREEFEDLWNDFEGILSNLVRSFLDLLSRLDRICAYEEPTKEIRRTLLNLLGSEERRAYFFRELEFPTWLKPLKEDRWFDPDQNPMPQESPEQSGYYYSPRWHALEYVVKVSTHPECPVDILVDIVNAITDESRERIDNGWTDLDTIKIIGTLPINRIIPQHISFMGAALKSIQKYGLMDQEIGQTILPKLLNGGKQELTLELLAIMLEIRSDDTRIQPIMNNHWLEVTLKKHGQDIANLCGVEAAQIVLEQIRAVDREDPFAFNFIQLVESDISQLSVADYTELIVSFTSLLYQFAEPNSIKSTVRELLNEPHAIIRRIGVNAINHHYEDLRDLFWNWEGNPLDEYELKPEMYQLIQNNSSTFNDDEMEQILQWIESTQD